MRVCNGFPAVLAVTLALIPTGAFAAGSAGDVAGGLDISAVHGKEAVRISGTAPGAHLLQAAVYAKFSQDLPTVLLSRRPVTADADGRYSTTLPVASAYFRGAIVTVVVQTPAGVRIARGSLTLAAPNGPAPADEMPPSYR